MTDPNPSDEDIVGSPAVSHHSNAGFPVPTAAFSSRTGRWLWWVVGVALLVASLVWVFSMHGAMNRLESRLSASAVRQDVGARAEQQQILSFEARLARILGSSVESKLRALERSVERGPLSADELRLLESTASELRLLQSNQAVAAGLAVEGKDHPRYQAAGSAHPASSTLQDSLDDIAQLRKFYYAALICFALVGLMVVGLWSYHRRRYRLTRQPVRHQLPVIRSYQEDRGH